MQFYSRTCGGGFIPNQKGTQMAVGVKHALNEQVSKYRLELERGLFA